MHLYMIFFGVFHLSVVQLAGIKQERQFIRATVGDNVTLKCFYDSSVAMHFSWYRLTSGGGLELLSSVYKYDSASKVYPWMKTYPRYSLQRREGINHLHISDVQFSDSASFFCGSSHSNIPEFGDGVVLIVKGANLKKIDQTPVSKTFQPGDSVDLHCTVHTGTCDEKPSVYWVRKGSNKGILDTQGDGCEQVSTEEASSLSCVYHLQKVNLSSSDAGTYFCAVASCGEILFGSGTTLISGDNAEYKKLHMTVLLWLSIMRICVLMFFVFTCYFIYRCKSRKSLL